MRPSCQDSLPVSSYQSHGGRWRWWRRRRKGLVEGGGRWKDMSGGQQAVTGHTGASSAADMNELWLPVTPISTCVAHNNNNRLLSDIAPDIIYAFLFRSPSMSHDRRALSPFLSLPPPSHSPMRSHAVWSSSWLRRHVALITNCRFQTSGMDTPISDRGKRTNEVRMEKAAVIHWQLPAVGKKSCMLFVSAMSLLRLSY